MSTENPGVGGTKQPVKFGSDGCDKIKSTGPGGGTSFPGSKGQGHIRGAEGKTGS